MVNKQHIRRVRNVKTGPKHSAARTIVNRVKVPVVEKCRKYIIVGPYYVISEHIAQPLY